MIGTARAIAKGKPDKLQRPLYDLLLMAILAGQVAAARRLLGLLYGHLPHPTKVVTALSTHALDGLSLAAGWGDVTHGQPTTAYGLGVIDGPLEARVAAAANGMMTRLVRNAFMGAAPTDDTWRDRPAADPWRAIERWRRVQGLLQPEVVTAARERDALARLDAILGDIAAGARPVAGGSELVVALDLALRHGDVDRARAWATTHAAIVRDQVDALACLPSSAKALVEGLFSAASAHSPAAIEAEASAVEAALEALSGAPARKLTKPPKVQRRQVVTLYSQLYVEPADLTAAESKQVYFQRARDVARGMSPFTTKVGITTPPDTASVDVRVVFEPDAGELDIGDALQAVVFPLTVRDGGVCLRGVADEEGEPLVIPSGRYDVAALFTAPARRTKGLRKLGLTLSFRREGALAAPRTLRLADG